MKRLGKYTGKIYEDDYNFELCPECCVCISDDDAKNENYISERHNKDLLGCISCMGCPAARR